MTRAAVGSSFAIILALGKYAALAACTLLSGIAWAGADSEWVPVTDRSLVVREGSALDFSSLVPHTPAGMHGRLGIVAGGHFEFSGLPGTRQRFWSASVAFSPPNGGFPSPQLADLYARQLRLHGYNMIRLQQIEAMLMVDRNADFDFEPEQLDRFHYFLAALKAQGIYWVIDILTSENGAYGGVYPHRWINKHSMRVGVYVDPARQAHWRMLAEKLLLTKNPHTGLSLAEDPALAGLILVNEIGISYLSYLNGGKQPAELAPQFATWSRKNIGSDEELRRRWGGEISSGESISAGNVRLPASVKERSERMRDFLRFTVDLETSTVGWMTRHLRDLGYKGLVNSLNNVSHLHADYSRRTLDWIDMHMYFSLPTKYDKQGSQISQKSSLEQRLPYFRELAATRQLGKPFTVSEYGQPFWNQWRREAGIAMGAYARLQDWDMICQYGENSIELSMAPSQYSRKNAIMPYGIGLDPIARATEVLAGLLFQRGDVKPSASRLSVNVSEDQVFRYGGGWASMPGDITTLALFSGLGVSFGKDKTASAGKSLQRTVAVEFVENGIARQLQRLDKWVGGDLSGQLKKRMDGLRHAGVLPNDNQSDPDKGLFHSDTGEILLDASRRALSVITPKTEALAFNELPGPKQGRMRVTSATGPALMALSAIDGKPLNESRRILAILASDAINTGMTFSDAERKTLATLGTLPARIRKVGVVVEFDSALATNLSLFALKLNGERAGPALPVDRTSKGIRFRLDIEQPHGPTTFFELAPANDGTEHGSK